MYTLNPNVDLFLTEGCGRCQWGGTPQCKVHLWPEILDALREILLDCGLTEEFKWSQPCYSHQNKNILILTAARKYATLAFFKGSLLSDPQKILFQPGVNSQAVRQFRFTKLEEVFELTPIIKAYIFEAIEVEKAGLKVQFKKPSEIDISKEFQQKLDEIPALKIAFKALTPGRQKAYLHYFSQAKMEKTRITRIEKYIPYILEGLGLNDLY